MFEIRTYLKEQRMNKGISANNVAKRIGMSQGHLSGIENLIKNIPNEKFIEKYLKTISNDSKEYNEYVDYIHEHGEGKYKLSHNVKSDSMIAAFINEDKVDRHTYYNKSGELVENGFDFDINDLEYHLTNENNSLFYKGEKLSDDDKTNIQKLVKDYLVNFEIVKEKTLVNLHEEKIIDDEKLESEKKKIQSRIRKIKY